MLYVYIYMNEHPILLGTARRTKGDMKPQTINTYELHDGTVVKHRYGDGAQKLAQKILERPLKGRK